MKNANHRSNPLVIAALLGLVAAGCRDEKNLQSCSDLCRNRVLCEEERGNPPPSQTSCETACLAIKGDEFVARSEACVNEASCEYVACVDSEIPPACQALCKNRMLCEEERGNTPPSQASCETECLGAPASDRDERAEACAEKTSCDYVDCADGGGGGAGGEAP